MSLIKIDAEESARQQRALDTENQQFLDKTRRVEHAARATEKFEPANADLRTGRAVSAQEIERRLLKEQPNFVFRNHPSNPTKKCMYLKLPNGQLQYIMPYESGMIPEHSIMTEQFEDVLDPESLRPGWNLSAYKADMPKSETTPCEISPNGDITKMGTVTFDESKPLPGFKRLRVGWREVVRGYRTMCGILLSSGYLTESQATRVAGPSDSPQWAGIVGRRPKEEPWA